MVIPIHKGGSAQDISDYRPSPYYQFIEGCIISLKNTTYYIKTNLALEKTQMFKLEHYGVRDTMLRWFLSYLSDRKQLSFNGQSSELLKNNCGVPQGSVFGPLLFFAIH